MPRCLYYALKAAETVNQSMEERRRDFFYRIDHSGHSLISDSMKVSFTEIDVEDYQRKLIKQYTIENPILSDAIRGGRSITSALSVLNDSVAAPNRRFFPRTKNKFYDNQVECAERLVGELPQLKTGVFRMNNFLSGVAYSATFVSGLSFLLSKLMGIDNSLSPSPMSPEDIEMQQFFITHIFAPGLSAVFAPLAGALSTKSGSISDTAREKAKYLDERIFHLYLKI